MRRAVWGAALSLLFGCGEVRLVPREASADAGVTGWRTARANPVPAENALPGDADWEGGLRSRDHEVELYLSTDSATAGDAFTVFMSASVPSQVKLAVYRLGDYGGAGARKLWQAAAPLAVERQPPCPADPVTQRVACAWQEAASVEVPASWLSGLYVVKATRQDGYFRFAPLVVRDGRAAELLFGAAVNTYQAYNAWGGESLYDDASGTMPSGRAHEVSFDRPYDGDEGAGQELRYEAHLARFLERNGYDVTYASNLDFVREPRLLEGITAFVHGGHDEYWTPEQRAAVDGALVAGTSLLHFGGNGAYWRTRAVADPSGRLRTLACYKSEPSQDPQQGSTLRYRDPGVDQPETLLFGGMYDSWQVTPFPLVVKDATHWLLIGTGLGAGDLLPGLVGYEFDRVVDGFPLLAPVETPFESPVISAESVPSRAHVTALELPSGAHVFSAGSIYWPLGLSGIPGVHDPRVERMTFNALERALSARRPAHAVPAVTGSSPQQPPPRPRWAKRVDTFVGGAGSAPLLTGPTALALRADGSLLVADTSGNSVRLVGTDREHTVTTVAGNGLPGYRDGAGSGAMFRAPAGLAVFPDGSVAVADSDNHVLRKLVPGNAGWSVSTLAGVARTPGGTDGAASSALFNRPTALALSQTGELLVADQAGHRVRALSADGQQVRTLAGSAPGYADASVGTAAQFNTPTALAVGKGGEIYVLDSGNQKLRRVDAGAPWAVITLAGRLGPILLGYWQQGGSFGFADGPGDEARFLAQSGLAVDGSGAVLVADSGNARLRAVVPGSSAATSFVYTVAGNGRMDVKAGSADQAGIPCPAGIALSPDGRVFVSDPFHGMILQITR